MIHLSIDSNEAMRPRADLIRKAADTDDRFCLSDGRFETPFDLRFDLEDVCEKYYEDVCCEPCSKGPCTKFDTMHIEIKDFSDEGNSDYLSSVLSGHLWEQCLAARERGEPMIIVVLGDDRKTQEAIRKAAAHPTKGTGFDMQKFLAYSSMVDGFEANCEGAHIRILHLGYNQFPRLLLRVRKILQGGDLSSFIPHPVENERNEVGFSILCGKGIGIKKAKSVLSHYEICLVPKEDGFKLHACPGIGEQLSKQISNKFLVSDTRKT